MAPKKAKARKIEPVEGEDLAQRLSNFCFTINNYTDECVEKMKNFILDYCDYGIYAKEVGEQGTPHLQGYCELKDRKSIRQIRKLTPEKIANIKARRSPNPKVAAGYCKKGDDPKKGENEDSDYYQKYFTEPGPGYEGFEHGEISSPGQRTDIVKAHNAIKSGEKSVRELRQENPMLYHVYGRVLNQLEDDYLSTKCRHPDYLECDWMKGFPTTGMTKGIWFTGAEGRGKSHALFMCEEAKTNGKFDPSKVYDWNLDEEFQTYAGEPVICINEYKGIHQIKYGTWLKLVDKWPYKIKRKNLCPYPMLAHTVIVASIFDPTEIEWNLSTKDNLNQLLDRFEIKKLEGPNRRQQITN